MKKFMLLAMLALGAFTTTCWLAGGDVNAQGYPLGSDVAVTITTGKFSIVGAGSTLVATDNANRVFCKIVQRGTNAIDVGYSLSVTNGQQDYIAGTAGATWETKRPALYKGPVSLILDGSTATLTSAVTVIEGSRQGL
jgi:hypothetical protein